jgi:uncharacterized protein YlxW (UPF0749 family)
MKVGSMSIQGLQVTSLALTATERWAKSSGPFDSYAAYEGNLAVFAVLALILSVILLLWVSAKRTLSEQHLNKKNTDLTVANFELWQENNQLQTTNKELQQEVAELSRKQVEIRESIIDPVNTKEVNPSAKPSRN